ncbi:Ribosomal protein S6 kinase alpha-2 (S6K-alpha-2) (90 kDa ribosomal protein S6 kinase 2) (p90-RSK 2) (p90RSK2) (MAP kinase-activated protein kinase 1c) (MAPK-activated protein kinase 1c) (MAPKAP kinase 1c) (MAPKAPK-1c) (Ribosomal S6 kinase 3) (RSK-3) (pp90RSK3), partial [Durusdinium trenchii]
MAAPCLRLRGKQPWPKPACSVKTKKRPKGDLTQRMAAVRDGFAPKACRPFALFLKKHSEVPKGSSRDCFAKEMQRLGKLWASLPENEKAKYRALCVEEYARQRDSLKQSGLGKVRRQPAKPQQEPLKPASETQLPAAERPTPFHNFVPVADPSNTQQCVLLGEGSYGCVMLCHHLDGRKCAVKVFKGKSAIRDMQWEASLMKLCVQAPEAHWFPSLWEASVHSKPFPSLALELWGCSLLALLQQQSGGFEEATVKSIALQLRAALQQLHCLCILHLDVKPGNILWLSEASHLKLTDLGMSERLASHDGTDEIQPRYIEYVSAHYRPPELWNASIDDLRRHLQPAVDLWSYGIVVYECESGTHLMAPLKPKGSCKQTIQAWCSCWKWLSSTSASLSQLSQQSKAGAEGYRMDMTEERYDKIASDTDCSTTASNMGQTYGGVRNKAHGFQEAPEGCWQLRSTLVVYWSTGVGLNCNYDKSYVICEVAPTTTSSTFTSFTTSSSTATATTLTVTTATSSSSSSTTSSTSSSSSSTSQSSTSSSSTSSSTSSSSSSTSSSSSSSWSTSTSSQTMSSTSTSQSNTTTVTSTTTTTYSTSSSVSSSVTSTTSTQSRTSVTSSTSHTISSTASSVTATTVMLSTTTASTFREHNVSNETATTLGGGVSASTTTPSEDNLSESNTTSQASGQWTSHQVSFALDGCYSRDVLSWQGLGKISWVRWPAV